MPTPASRSAIAASAPSTRDLHRARRRLARRRSDSSVRTLEIGCSGSTRFTISRIAGTSASAIAARAHHEVLGRVEDAGRRRAHLRGRQVDLRLAGAARVRARGRRPPRRRPSARRSAKSKRRPIGSASGQCRRANDSLTTATNGLLPACRVASTSRPAPERDAERREEARRDVAQAGELVRSGAPGRPAARPRPTPARSRRASPSAGS